MGNTYFCNSYIRNLTGVGFLRMDSD